MAVLQACETIKERLEKFHQSLSEAPEGSSDAVLREKLDGLRTAAQERGDLRNDDYFKAVVNAVRSQFIFCACPACTFAGRMMHLTHKVAVSDLSAAPFVLFNRPTSTGCHCRLQVSVCLPRSNTRGPRHSLHHKKDRRHSHLSTISARAQHAVKWKLMF